MNILVVGGGGREHAIIRKLKENSSVEHIWALPGNGGIAMDAECFPVKATDIEGIVSFAKEHRPDYAVVAPDDPLVMGLVDELTNIGIPCFGPDAKAAIIEGSKLFSKELMKKYDIPTARYHSFDDIKDALYYVESAPVPAVIKADGPALGKGVIIAETREDAAAAVKAMMEDHRFGASGDRIVIEEFLEGPEVSVLAFTDGSTVIPMISSMDHKRIGDGDTGLNTGGMGTVAPNPYYTEEVAARCMEEIFLPTIRAMNAEGRRFRGCLYFGLMITKDGPKVIEYNCRFGDPETQVVLPLLDTDLFTVMRAVRNGTLSDVEIRWKDASACCVILASEGYPKKYATGFPITLPDNPKHGAEIYIAGAKWADGQIVTSGGRVLGVTAVAPTLEEAVKNAYEAAEDVHFENAYMRHDIGRRALAAKGE